ncbi:hypothetical protein [Candidatus Lokiarchaeum ossiferum]|uniref:hypothetical protein n=1 Tax=Candidatus Lokiarchaeum ossiferum TaxID=2951803 RepID=UPI00352F1FA6
MNKKKKSSSENTGQSSKKFKKSKDEKTPLELLLSKTKFHIYSYLEMYQQLTSADFERLLSKSKSTIHTHLQDLIEIGIIAVPEMRDIKGNMIYRLAEGYNEKIGDFDSDVDFSSPNTSEKDLLKIIQIESAFAKINQANSQYLVDFGKKINEIAKTGLDSSNLAMLRDMTKLKRDKKGNLIKDDKGNSISQFDLLSSFNYMSRAEYLIFREEWSHFLNRVRKKYEELRESGDELSQNDEKVMLVTTTGMPIKRLLEFLN